jgi:outer membrane protein assembly factor BamB
LFDRHHRVAQGARCCSAGTIIFSPGWIWTRSQVWSKQITSSLGDVATAVALSPSNELFVTGATFQRLGSTSHGQQDAFVLKINKATGETVWAAQAGSPDSEVPTSLAFDDAGNIYIAGSTSGAIGDSDVNQGGLDVFAMKFDPSGKLLSTWQTGTPEHDLVTSMVVNCGKVLLGGFTRGALVEGSSGTTGEDMFVIQAPL